MKKFLGLFLVTEIIFSLVNFAYANENYQLEKVVIFSRHNVRAPLGHDYLSNITNNKWIEWTSNDGELSMRGGMLETAMGQYFRKYLEHENFMPENYIPKNNEFRFYANSVQRTIATAQYFSSGMLPLANVKIEHKYPVGKADEYFSMKYDSDADKLREKIFKQIFENNNAKSFKNVADNLKPDLNQLEEVLDFKNSAYAKENHIMHFPTDDLEVIVESNKSPNWKGGVRNAARICDALIMQYYESKPAFTDNITARQWESIARIHYFSVDMIFGTQAASVELAKPMLKFMGAELTNNRKFTFICGHDSNVMSMLSALDVENYLLPNTVESKIPIGVKFVIEKRIGSDGNEYAKVYLAYQNDRQIRNLEMLSLENPPQIYDLKFKNLRANSDGLYLYSDFVNHWNELLK